MEKSQSHELEHCECTVHVPAGVITGKPSGKFKMYLQCSRWVHCWYTVHFLVMYLQCSWWEHHHLPPVCLYSRRSGQEVLSRFSISWIVSRQKVQKNFELTLPSPAICRVASISQ